MSHNFGSIIVVNTFCGSSKTERPLQLLPPPQPSAEGLPDDSQVGFRRGQLLESSTTQQVLQGVHQQRPA